MLRFRLQGVVTVVDAINGPATLDAQEEAVKQVAVADRLVLTKADLADTPERREALLGLAGARARARPFGSPDRGAGRPRGQPAGCRAFRLRGQDP
jgi:G3E family GTPase